MDNYAGETTRGEVAVVMGVDVLTERPLSLGYDAATVGDPDFNRDFRHGFTTVDDVPMRYVIGGRLPRSATRPSSRRTGIGDDLVPG